MKTHRSKVYYSTMQEAQKALERKVAQGERLGILRKYRVQAWLSFASSDLPLRYTVERIVER